MDEEQNGENEDYDREDIEHVENMLYANIHYNTGSTESPNTSTHKINPMSTINAQNQYAINNTDTDRRNSGSRRNAKRYWSSNTPNTSNASNFVPYYKEKQSGIYKSPKPTTVDATVELTEQNEPNTALAMIAPKQFTPYVSFLPFDDSVSMINEQDIPVAGGNKNPNISKVLKSTNESIRKNVPTTSKNINPFSKKHMIDEYKKILKNEQLINATEPLNQNTTKRLNPFNPLSKKAKRRKSDVKIDQTSKCVQKNRAESKQKIVTENVIAVNSVAVADNNVIDVDDDDDKDNANDDDDDDDDDVIILPTQAPPLICVDDSDDEIIPSNTQEHAFTEPNAVTDCHRKVTRCASPSSSIQSADDFIAQNDQRNFGFETFGTLSDDDLCQVSETFDNQNNEATTSKQVNENTNDNSIFTPPKQMQKEKLKTTIMKKSYEVTNNFTSVDVYESESSDMPDTIYAKGNSNKRKQLSDSDSSSVESIPISKAKRLRKRKSSGSAKESDKLSSVSSSELSEIDDTDDDDDDDHNDANSNDDTSNAHCYLVRGEALGKVKNTNKKKKLNVVKLNESVNETNDKFINQLSDIFRGQNESDENDDIENTQETSTDSVAARDIVETVLQRRTKKSKKNHTEEENCNQITFEKSTVDTTPTEVTVDVPADNPSGQVSPETPNDNDNTNAWKITDQIGETDDLNLGGIFEDSSLNDTSVECVENNVESEPINANISVESNQQIVDHNDDQENANFNYNRFFETEVGWNEEMRRFYNDSWGGETFSVRNIRSRMPKGFLNWMISNQDKSILYDNRPQMRCRNCQQRGHIARNCPPRAVFYCYMCGVKGHSVTKCPNKICLLCGRKSNRFVRGCGECARDRDTICYICKQKGHKQLMCPDQWRRYHSTTSLDQPLVEEPKNLPPRPKYCCTCAQKGHDSETCFRRPIGTTSVHVTSYRPILVGSQRHTQSKPIPNCTILTSDINDFSFNFGNDVSNTGNTIYARFRRAVNLNGDQNRSTTSENEIMFVNEKHLHDTSNPPIEIYDDFDYEDLSTSDINSSENNSFMTIDNMDGELSATNESKIDYDDNVNVTANNSIAELKELDNKLKTLNDLKEKLRSYQTNENENDNNQNMNASDVTIESEMDNHTDAFKSDQRNDVSTSNPLPDFIPLTSNKPELYEPVRSPSPVSADSTTTEKSDATIHLTAQHWIQLLDKNGTEFIQEREKQLNVSIRLEWRNFGKVLIVNGLASNQKQFHDELKQFFAEHERTKPTKPKFTSFANCLPKNRESLIKLLRQQFVMLDSAICNNKNIADVHSMFNRICHNSKNPSKANLRQMSKLRKHLNMILFGRYGFADGQTHLNALQNQLSTLMKDQRNQVDQNYRKQIATHLDYIFSDMEHDNYRQHILRYEQLKKEKSLPPLNIDRKLLGLNINIYSNDGNDNTSNNMDYDRPTLLPNASYSAEQSNLRYAQIASGDISINVSPPFTSYNNSRVSVRLPMQRFNERSMHDRYGQNMRKFI